MVDKKELLNLVIKASTDDRTDQEKNKEMLRLIPEKISTYVKNREDQQRLEDIIKAMHIVDRKFFVEDKRYAYLDTAMPLSHGQTISQPSTVARMLQLAMLEPRQDLLEVGSASGWSACTAAYLVYLGITISIDRIPELVDYAEANRSKLVTHLSEEDPESAEKLSKIEFRLANVFDLASNEDRELRDYPRYYDRIIITAGISEGQESKLKMFANNLLNDNGLLICPYQLGPLVVMIKFKQNLFVTSYGEYWFVPLVED